MKEENDEKIWDKGYEEIHEEKVIADCINKEEINDKNKKNDIVASPVNENAVKELIDKNKVMIKENSNQNIEENLGLCSNNEASLNGLINLKESYKIENCEDPVKVIIREELRKSEENEIISIENHSKKNEILKNIRKDYSAEILFRENLVGLIEEKDEYKDTCKSMDQLFEENTCNGDGEIHEENAYSKDREINKVKLEVLRQENEENKFMTKQVEENEKILIYKEEIREEKIIEEQKKIEEEEIKPTASEKNDEILNKEENSEN